MGAVPAPGYRVGAIDSCPCTGLTRTPVWAAAAGRVAGLINDLAAQEGMGLVDARVQDRHGPPGSVITGTPGFGTLDQGNALSQRGRREAVFGHAGDTGRLRQR